MPSADCADTDKRSPAYSRHEYDLEYSQNGGIEKRKGRGRRSQAEERAGRIRETLRFEMPLYEVKYHEKDEWTEISDLKLMDQLYRSFNKVTPAIKEMIMGKEVKTEHGIFRLKLKGGDL